MSKMLAEIPRQLAETTAVGLTSTRVAIIGAGTMGRIIASGLLRGGILSHNRLFLADRSPGVAARVATEVGGIAQPDNASACRQANVIILCVKPNDVPGVLEEIREALPDRSAGLLISIAAGVTLASIEEIVGADHAVIRAMPNTACRVGSGMTVVSPGTGVVEGQVSLAREIFGGLGRCIVLPEKHLDSVTAVSASGLAFLFVAIEALADGGVMCGLPRDVAILLASQTALGAADMALTTKTHPAALKDEVTTPGGCTIAGLLALEDGRIRSVFARAVEAAAKVASGLGR